jgi:hypothetical protein
MMRGYFALVPMKNLLLDLVGLFLVGGIVAL